MTLPAHYRKPFLITLACHIALVVLLVANFEAAQFHAPPSSASMATVQATTITQAQLDQAVKSSQTSPQAQPQQPPSQQKTVPNAAAPTPISNQALAQANIKETQQKAIEARALASAQAKKLQNLQQKLIQQQIAIEQKQLTASKTKEKPVTVNKQASAKAQELKKLQQQLMQQQIASEQKNISQVLSTAQQGVLDQYKAQLLSVIQSNWRIDKVDSKLKCIYSVTLAPDGTVVSENLVRSSGDDNLDQSAKEAIIQSSPLPVPSDPALFGHFRQLLLTLSPQGYLQSVQ